MTERLWPPILVAAAAALAVAALGASATDIGPWYQSLREPAGKPPDWLFGPAWTLIYALTALAGVIAWRATKGRAARQFILTLFAANALLNVLWSETVLQRAPPRLVSDRGRAVLAQHRGARRGPLAAVAPGGLVVGALSRLGGVRRLAEPAGGAAEPVIRECLSVQ